MDRSQFVRILALLAAALAFGGAHAQDEARTWPERPLRLMVGYAAGGGNDIVARVIGQQLTEALGQQVVVENKPGAAGGIAASYVAKASPDGYTLLFAPSSMFTTNPVMFRKLPYSLADFVPISTVVSYPLILVVGATQPPQSARELVDYLKANPARSNCAGAAGLFQLACALFKGRTGTQGEYISYKGTNQSVAAVMSGEVMMTLADAGPVSGALKGGRVRGLAVTSQERLPAYPHIPTVAEAGYPGLEMGSWMGLMAPAGTPPAIVRKLQQQLRAIVQSQGFRERMAAMDLRAESCTSEQFGAMITADLARWRGVASQSHIEPAD